MQTTRGITIPTPPGEVWPWLVQMGFGRGGWYSYDALERLVGAGEFTYGASATRVIPELQSLALGDTVPLSALGGPTVAVLDAPHALVLHGGMNLITGALAAPGDAATLDWTWASVLTPLAGGSCRLLVRLRAACRPRAAAALMPVLIEPVHFLMERKMLRTIAERSRRGR